MANLRVIQDSRWCVLKPELAKVMYFNQASRSWEDDNITDVEIDIDSGEVRFKTTHFKPTAVVQHTYIEFPYLDWSITPTGLNTAIISINGKINDVKILVSGGDCELMYPLGTAYMDANFKGVRMSPSLLLKVYLLHKLQKMSMIGLNFKGPTSLKGIEVEEDFILKVSIQELNPEPNL